MPKLVKEMSYMPPRRKVSKIQAQKSERTIQYVAIAVVLVLIAVFVWSYLPRNGAPQYDSAPPMSIDVNGTYLATVKLEKGGEFVIELYPAQAPVTVNNFVFLAQEGFYDGVTFHRVLDGFMAQTGDPTGTGAGGPGYKFEDEINDLAFDREGVVAMANAGPNTNGSQFFVTFGPTEHLNGLHTIFGQVVSGMDVVRSLTQRDPNQLPTYEGDTIETILIAEE
jgi:cyclophilin family peptidyl-prolyl cis-trans isomerase